MSNRRKNQAKLEKLNKTEPKLSQAGFCPKKLKPVGLNRFRFGFGFFKKNQFGYFFYKNRTESKMITPVRTMQTWLIGGGKIFLLL
jgi:hypothetical protein